MAELIGPHAVHHGVELRQPLVELARRLARERGLGSITFHAASMHTIDAPSSMRFDRIFVGAGASLAERTHVLSLVRHRHMSPAPHHAMDLGSARLVLRA